MSKKQLKNRKRKIHIGRLFLCLSVVGVLCAGTLYGIREYSYPELYGKWQSEETKKIVKFNRDGTVVLEESDQSPTFKVLTPNKIRYEVEDKTFEMYYDLEGRALEWGMTEETIETFKRK
ncbi:MAG: hypothetical protein ACRCWY_14480 [Cellulosilyticaceae bacterium]